MTKKVPAWGKKNGVVDAPVAPVSVSSSAPLITFTLSKAFAHRAPVSARNALWHGSNRYHLLLSINLNLQPWLLPNMDAPTALSESTLRNNLEDFMDLKQLGIVFHLLQAIHCGVHLL